ncbi:hypothetical protein V499_05554 [Pseudogymnoascus sp. VKM F-103]|nr:hypothetical protein V499_05554 [Pseudogymnoascus sp. VKM F-103]
MDTQGRKKVLDGYDNIDLDGLQDEMCDLLGLKCQFIIDTRKRPFGASECVIVVLEDEKGLKWAVRFPLQFRAFPEHVMVTVRREAELRLAIEKAGIQGIMRMMAFSATFDNPVRFPFIVFEWAEGTQLRWTESFPAVSQRDKVHRKYSHFIYHNPINRKIKRAENNKLPGATISECLDQQSLIAEYLIPDLDNSPCVLVHGDLTAENVTVDEEFNVKAIINLGFAEIIPLQFSACFPDFLTYDFESEHEPVEVEYGGGSDGPLFYLRCVEEFSRGDPMLEAYYKLLAAEDAIKRYWWFVAATKLKVHRAMAACSWLRTGPASKPQSL